MVQVHVGQDHRIDAARFKRKAFVLNAPQGIAALTHAAVQQHAAEGGRVEQMARACNFLCCAVKSNGSHESTPEWCCVFNPCWEPPACRPDLRQAEAAR